MDPFVSPQYWAARRESIQTADVRWYLDGRSGRAAFEAGHLPGAVLVELEHCLSGPPGPEVARHPLPDPSAFARCMSAAGIGDHSTVVAYDDQGGVIAARLVWMLRALGVEAALLDGGLAAFGGELATGAPRASQPAAFSARPWPQSRLAEIGDLFEEGIVLVDARDPERFRGEWEPVDPRAGHIPGAVNLPCRANLDPGGRLAGSERLRRRFAAAGISDASRVVSYCGSGVTACHNLLVMEAVGLGRGRLYPGSWSQYSASGAGVELGD